MNKVKNPLISAFERLSSNIGAKTQGFYDDIIDSEAAWLACLQTESGAIPMQPHGSKDNRIVPYYSNFAALGLLERQQYYGAVKKYMDWYFAHLNNIDYNGIHGTVYDYKIVDKDNTEQSMNSYDSTDSYAATFLSLVAKYCRKTGDNEYPVNNRTNIEAIGNAILQTRDKDGMTWAKPDFKLKYLMDNAEVFAGMKDAEWIYRNIYRDNNGVDRYLKYANNVLEGIETKLWNNTVKSYKYYIDEKNRSKDSKWTDFYPDAAAQLYPIWTGILNPESGRALNLYDTFNHYHPGWPDLNIKDGFPWALVAYTGAIIGDKKRVNTFLNSIKKQYIEKGHPWKWYSMEAGTAILAAQRLEESLL